MENEIMMFSHICRVCKKDYYSANRQQSICDDCKEEIKARKRYADDVNSEIYHICKELNDYNKEHGTDISYGQYVAGRRR